MKKALCLFMAIMTVVSVLSVSFPAAAQEIEENNAVLVSKKVSAMCEKYDGETDTQSENTDTDLFTVDERLIVKTDSRINTYNAVQTVYGLGFAFIQFESDEDADAAFDAYQKQGYTVLHDSVISLCGETAGNSSSETSDNWAYERLEIPKTLGALEAAGKDYADITVGVIDTGVDYNHELFDGRLTRTDLNFSSSGNENDCMDEDGHGTSVAGVIALSTPDNVKIEPYKLFDSYGKCTVSELYCLLDYIINMNNRPDVINMSFEIKDVLDEIDTSLFEELYDNGVTVVVSAGNDGYDVMFYKPAGIEPFITVSSSDENNNRYSNTNFGELVDIAAPGKRIYSSALGGTYADNSSGTSAAASFVSSAAAIVLMQNDELTPDEVKDKLKKSAVPIQKNADFDWSGAGLLNFYGLIDQPKLSNVEFSYTGGDYYEPLALELTCGDPDAKIIYTTDMSVPSLTNGTVYTAPIDITERSQILAVACDETGKLRSDYSFAEYRVIYEPEESDFEIDDKGAITAYNGTHKAIIVPDTVNSVTPVSVGSDAFLKSDIEYIVLPESVDYIDTAAFRESALESITAPGVTDVYTEAFFDCENLYYEYMPKVQYASNLAFSGCLYLTDFSFKDTLIDAGYRAFRDTSLLEADFPNLELIDRSFESTPCYYASLPKVTDLEGGFRECENLCHIYIPNLTEISSSAFEDCDLLDENDIDFTKITKVGNLGFAGTCFKTIDLPNCTEVDGEAFSYADAAYISIPKVKEIGAAAFHYTYQLEEVNMESAETFLTYNLYRNSPTFLNSMKLKNLILPNAKEIPAIGWDTDSVGFTNSGSEGALEFIYAPKATGFTLIDSDFYYCKDFEFIFAPNLESFAVSDGVSSAYRGIRFPEGSEIKLYLTDKFTSYTDFDESVANLLIIAPGDSYANTVATENGYEFIPSDSLVNTKGRSICVTAAGIRFGFDWNNISEIESLADNIEYGFVYSQKGAQELTVENVNGDTVKQATATKRVESDGNTSYNLVLANIPAANLNSSVNARAYVCIDGMYFYSDMLTGSFSGVAELVLADDEIDESVKDAIRDILNKQA